MLPHWALPQVTLHVTPALALSFATTAVRLVVVPATTDAGAAGLNVTAITGAVAVMEIVAEAVLVVSVTEVAVTVTEIPPVEGAV
jgi:hypothetical protein